MREELRKHPPGQLRDLAYKHAYIEGELFDKLLPTLTGPELLELLAAPGETMDLFERMFVPERNEHILTELFRRRHELKSLLEQNKRNETRIVMGNSKSTTIGSEISVLLERFDESNRFGR
jgi:hypothetical protein